MSRVQRRGGMAVVILEPMSARLAASVGRSPFWRRDQGAVLVMTVRLPHHAGIWLESEEKNFTGDVTLSLCAATMEHLEAIAKLVDDGGALGIDDVVGSMRYTPARRATGEQSAQKAAFEFEAFVPAKFMGDIVRLARRSRFPRKIWLDVRGLGYRSGQRVRDARLSWPQKIDQPALPITDVSFEFPHHPHRDISLFHGDREESEAETASREAAHSVRRLEPVLIRISARLIWVIWFLVVIVVGMAFLIWR